MVRRSRKVSRKVSGTRKLVTRKTVRKIVEGRTLRLSPDPSQITLSPWWPITILCFVAKEAIFTANVIWKEFVKQVTGLKPSDDASANLRVLKVRVWCAKPVNLTIRGALHNTTDTLHDLYDSPSKMNYARVGYAFGDTESQKVYSITDTTQQIFAVDPAGSDAATVYIDTLVRFQAKSLGQVLINRDRLNPQSLADMQLE